MHKIFDAHLHIIDPKFPLIENQGYLPDPFSYDAYLHRVRELEIIGGAIVSGSFQGFDQSYLIDSLERLGKNFVGVTQLPYDTPDEEIIKLNGHGVKAIRFNVKRGGSENVSKLDYFARRVHDLVGWHSELYIDSTTLPEIAPTIEKLPAVSIDHLGLSKDGFHNLLPLVARGVRVKATGFGRGDLDVESALRAIYSENPKALMFGTDLPSTRAKRPYDHSDIDMVYKALSPSQADDVLYKNAVEWYLK
ncbi:MULTISPECIES: amidohydrolase family protein [Bacillaceae]|uniref:Amidohydrolase family protein n=1 Tax=Evansella alkalicola TaxID=745819 RepID=A0ABS6JW69_9BACI|nr:MULTISPECIES: amidohydrolase family protein [Bacillaceae]MBU9722840.1 amidohydrolase family protein [Bacillus alkalicola]